MTIFDLANFLIIMIRFSIALTVALSTSLISFAQVDDVETYILNKSKPKGSLPPVVLETKSLPFEAYHITHNDSASVTILDTNALYDRSGQIPNSYQGDNCVSMPNAYIGDNCVPIPNAYHNNSGPATIVRRLPDGKTPSLSDTTIQELRKHLPDSAMQELLKGFEHKREEQDQTEEQPEQK